MNYIVLDLEWNQPSVISQNIEGLPFEIIEIGAYKLNENLEKIDSFHRIIKPKYYKRLNYHISQVVMITEQELDLGLDFEKAGQDFVDWCGKDFYFCVWGVSDVYTLRSNLGHYNIKHDFGELVFYLDIQKLFSFNFCEKLQRYTLRDAIDKLNISVSKDFHRALNDAYYTAEIMRCIDFRRLVSYKTLDLYTIPKNKKSEVHLHYDKYYKYISKGFQDSVAVMVNRQVRETLCPCCSNKIPRKINWFKDSVHGYTCLARCEKHGEFVGKIRLKHNDSKIFAIKILKKGKKDSANKIEQRRNTLRLKRREKRNQSNKGAIVG